MFEALLFVEDDAQESFLKRLVGRLASEAGVNLSLKVRVAQGGSGWVVNHLKRYAAGWKAGREVSPAGLIVALDANCQGYTKRRDHLDSSAGDLRHLVIHAIPDPHIERWLLLDSEAFKAVLGRGCNAPDEKCEKQRYKRLLAKAVLDAGIQPLLGGVEYAEELADKLNVQRVCDHDDSFNRFVQELRSWLNRLRQG
jgi:hypothetical protein